MDSTASFGTWLKLRRAALLLTQADLARLVGCATVTIRKIEADELRPSAQIAAKLAEHLDVLPEERAAFVAFARTNVAVGSHNLLMPGTPLIGRAQEIVVVRDYLARPDVRLDRCELFNSRGDT